MDVLKPELEIIDDICYRINPLHHCLASSTDKPIYNEEGERFYKPKIDFLILPIFSLNHNEIFYSNKS